MEHLIALGLANWIATTIIVESELFRPVREWADLQAHVYADLLDPTMYEDCNVPRRMRFAEVLWRKSKYVVGCHLCTGAWIAFAEVALTPWRPLGAGVAGFVLAALVVKAFGHLVLELRPQAWR